MEHKHYVEQPPPVVGVTSKSLDDSTGKDRHQHRHSLSFPPLERHKVSSPCSLKMVIQFKCVSNWRYT